MVQKRRKEDKITVLNFLKKTSTIIGALTIIIGAGVGGVKAYNKYLISNYDEDLTIKKNVKSIQGLNNNLVKMKESFRNQKEENNKQHSEIKLELLFIKKDIRSIDKSLKQIKEIAVQKSSKVGL